MSSSLFRNESSGLRSNACGRKYNGGVYDRLDPRMRTLRLQGDYVGGLLDECLGNLLLKGNGLDGLVYFNYSINCLSFKFVYTTM